MQVKRKIEKLLLQVPYVGLNINDTSVSAFHNVPSSYADRISYLITSFTFQPLTTSIIDSNFFNVKQKVEILHFTTCFNL